MSESDDHVIPYEEAVRRHRALEAEKRKGIIREVKISDAMSHLLELETVPQDEGRTPAQLRGIVEREFLEEEDWRSGRKPEERPDDASPDEAPACSLADRPEQTT
jgi:hypothetical protein